MRPHPPYSQALSSTKARHAWNKIVFLVALAFCVRVSAQDSGGEGDASSSSSSSAAGASRSVFSSYSQCVAALQAGGADPFGSTGTNSSIGGDFNSSYHFVLGVGDRYKDFQVRSVETGNFTTLAMLVNRSAVVVMFGMVSDPYMHYSAEGGFEGEYDFVDLFDYDTDIVTVVHVFTYEPFPSYPQKSFETGVVTESSVSVPQCKSWQDCTNMVTELVDTERLFPYSFVALDNMMGIYDEAAVIEEGGDHEQPSIFCSYGQGSRLVFLIDGNGIIQYTSPLFNLAELESAMEDLGDDHSVEFKVLGFLTLPVIFVVVVAVAMKLLFQRRQERERRILHGDMSYDQVPISETLDSIVKNIRRASMAVTAVQSTNATGKHHRSGQHGNGSNAREVEMTPDLQPRAAPDTTEMNELTLDAWGSGVKTSPTSI